MATRHFYPPHLKLSSTAREFLQRCDAIDEVTCDHAVWYTKHPDDKHTTVTELDDEIIASSQRSIDIIDLQHFMSKELIYSQLFLNVLLNQYELEILSIKNNSLPLSLYLFVTTRQIHTCIAFIFFILVKTFAPKHIKDM